ncbi:hypothetical protein ACRARG_12830 [Pseudooceanicola sp. C21-150M6]|uniref:hypothetical protein n=1 Tax=Pseudooceanicola sp. C21-150M6 TaxID=3434355 RepID=UPI003D7FC935
MNRLTEIQLITAAVLERDLSKLRALAEDERQLRSRLRDLDGQLLQSLKTASGSENFASDAEARRLWRRWLLARKKDTEMALFRILAQKEGLLDQVRNSFARDQASQGLVSEERERLRRAIR